MNEKERKILYSLCNGDISFTEAAELLGISKEEVEKMLESYTWTPSSEKLSELHEIEMETFLYIKEITQVKSGILQTNVENFKLKSSADMLSKISIGAMPLILSIEKLAKRKMKIQEHSI